MKKLEGERVEIARGDAAYPKAFERVDAPEKIYCVGDVETLALPGIAVIGARKMSAYGRTWAYTFGASAAQSGYTVINGGARGCDRRALEGALNAGGKCVVFLGGGIDCLYPPENAPLFQEIIDQGGVIVSEHEWDSEPIPWKFRARNRLTASLALATLVVEAGLPSGTYATCDYALDAGREVWSLPGNIDSRASEGTNKLIEQGAAPIISEQCLHEHIATLREVA